MPQSYSELPNSVATAANGVDYAYRDTGGHRAQVPLVLLQDFRGNLDYWEPRAGLALSTERMAVTVIDTDELIRRNATFADGRSFAGLTIRPGGNLRVIGCVDSRVDPSDVLGLKLGEATVIRNVGGRVTPATLGTLAMLAKVSQANSDGRPPGDAHLVVLHHTGCGMRDLAVFPEVLAEYFEIPVSDLDTKAVTDPAASLRVDVDVLKRRLPAGVFVYDVATGLIKTVVPPARVES